MSKSVQQSGEQIANVQQRLLSCQDVMLLTTLSRSTLYAKSAEGSFPAPITISPGRKAWIAAQVEAWIDARIAEAIGKAA